MLTMKEYKGARTNVLYVEGNGFGLVPDRAIEVSEEWLEMHPSVAINRAHAEYNTLVPYLVNFIKIVKVEGKVWMWVDSPVREPMYTGSTDDGDYIATINDNGTISVSAYKDDKLMLETDGFDNGYDTYGFFIKHAQSPLEFVVTCIPNWDDASLRDKMSSVIAAGFSHATGVKFEALCEAGPIVTKRYINEWPEGITLRNFSRLPTYADYNVEDFMRYMVDPIDRDNFDKETYTIKTPAERVREAAEKLEGKTKHDLVEMLTKAEIEFVDRDKVIDLAYHACADYGIGWLQALVVISQYGPTKLTSDIVRTYYREAVCQLITLECVTSANLADGVRKYEVTPLGKEILDTLDSLNWDKTSNFILNRNTVNVVKPFIKHDRIYSLMYHKHSKLGSDKKAYLIDTFFYVNEVVDYDETNHTVVSCDNSNYIVNLNTVQEIPPNTFWHTTMTIGGVEYATGVELDPESPISFSVYSKDPTGTVIRVINAKQKDTLADGYYQLVYGDLVVPLKVYSALNRKTTIALLTKALELSNNTLSLRF